MNILLIKWNGNNPKGNYSEKPCWLVILNVKSYSIKGNIGGYGMIPSQVNKKKTSKPCVLIYFVGLGEKRDKIVRGTPEAMAVLEKEG